MPKTSRKKTSQSAHEPAAATSAPAFTSMGSVKAPPPLSFTDNKTDAWRIFRKRWTNYALLTGLDQQSREFQVAMLENCLADDTLQLMNGFSFSTTDDERTVNEILHKLEHYAVGDVNETMERFLFHQRVQNEGEDFQNFLTEVRRLSKSCKFCENCEDSMVRDRIVLGIRDDATREALLKEQNLMLKQTISICLAAQSATTHNKAMKQEVVAKVSSENSKYSNRKNKGIIDDCKFCGTSHPRNKHKCPAYGETCNKCGKENHFAVKCPRKDRGEKQKSKVYQLVEDREDCDFVSKIESKVIPKKMIKCRMLVEGQTVDFQIDTGASVNLLPAKYCKVPLEKYHGKMVMWDNSEYKPLGKARLRLINPKNDKGYSVPFIIFDDKHSTPILGITASQEMGLVKIQQENFDMVAAMKKPPVDDNNQSDLNGMESSSLGELPGTHSLRIRPDAIPVVMAQRRIPIALRPKLKEELERLLSLGVLAPVEEPTPWVSQIVVTLKKSGEIRICLDPHELNKVLLREHYTLPVLDEVLHELKESKIFTKVDLSSGYWHVKIDEESSLLTTFQTCFGRFRWLRLPFGLNVASEIFQKKLIDAFEGLDGIVCIADDVVIHGRTKEEHDINMKRFLQCCKDKGIKLNDEKTEAGLTEITFMGHHITAKGVAIDPEKVKAVTEFHAPKNTEELRRFLGMVNYVARFIPNLTTLVYPLHNLLKKDVEWTWSENQQESFEDIKETLTNAPVLAYYDPEKELLLENDASEYGLGAVISQDGKPVAYASRTLSPAETRYAQIEKEMLAVTFGLEKFHHFTFGRDVRVVTDHKPLVAIKSKPLAKAPRRLQNLLLKAMNYMYTLEYKPGKEIPVADALSRAPASEPCDEETIHLITEQHFSSIRLDEIRGATLTDKTLMDLSEIIVKGWPNEKRQLNDSLKPFYDFRDELSVQDGIVVKGERVIIPEKLRRQMKERVHQGHLGINSCLRRAKDVMYWPGMASEIRQFIETCGTCATYQSRQAQEDQIITPVPSLPWQKVATDICSWAGKDYLITTDYHSNYFEFDLLSDLSSNATIVKLKGQFARHGIPERLVSDNGPQFTSEVFRMFAKTWGFTHETISPGNSQANGAAEAAVKIFKNILRKCLPVGDDPFIGLLNYRNTPTAGLNTSPAQRLLGRRTRSLLPMNDSKFETKVDSAQEAQLKEDKRARDLNSKGKALKQLKVGDNVRVEPYGSKKKEWDEATVSKQLTSRSYEVVTANGKRLRRNRRQLRAIPKSTHDQPPNAKARFTSNIPTNHSQVRMQVESAEKESELPDRKSTASNSTEIVRSRFGREIKPVSKYRS